MIFGELTKQKLASDRNLLKLVVPMLQRAGAYSSSQYSAEHIAAGLAADIFRLWGLATDDAELRAVAVSWVRNKTFEVVASGGPGVLELVHYLDYFAKAAAASGCERVVIEGPAAWRSDIPEGWKPAAVLYESVIGGSAKAPHQDIRTARPR